MSPRTTWVTRASRTQPLWITHERPVYHLAWACFVSRSGYSFPVGYWPDLCLTQEPMPGECWEISWVKAVSHREEDVHGNLIVGRGWEGMVPRVRDVTELLRADAMKNG